MFEDIPWGWWILVLLLAALIIAHVLVMPPHRPAFASKTAEWACFFRYAYLKTKAHSHISLESFPSMFLRFPAAHL
jgi:hypothetical protein